MDAKAYIARLFPNLPKSEPHGMADGRFLLYEIGPERFADAYLISQLCIAPDGTVVRRTLRYSKYSPGWYCPDSPAAIIACDRKGNLLMGRPDITEEEICTSEYPAAVLEIDRKLAKLAGRC